MAWSQNKSSKPKELSCNGGDGASDVMEAERPCSASRARDAKTRGIGDYKEDRIHYQTLNGLFEGPCPSIVAATVLEKTRRGVDKVSLLGEHMLS